MQIFPGVHLIQSVLGDRYLYQYLFVGETVVLLDAGVFATPESAIFPYMEKIGLSPARLSMVVGMHADVDHHGGLSAIKEASNSTLLACHAGDQQLIEDPNTLYQLRYNFLAQDHELGFGDDVMALCPRPCKIDTLLSAEDTIALSPGWQLKVWHVPGHSQGHLAIYDPRNHAAFTSDAVQAAGYPTVAGSMAFAPTYYSVNAYLSTIQFLEAQPIQHILTGHWPAARGSKVSRFLAQSRDFVVMTEAAVQAHLRAHRNGVTLREMICAISPQLGTWPENTAAFLQFAVYGHISRMEQTGIVECSSDVPMKYRLT